MGSIHLSITTNMALTNTDSLEFGDLDMCDPFKNKVDEIDEGNESEPEVSSLSSDDESVPIENGQDILTLQFMQLPKSRQDLLNNYKKDLEKAITAPYETFGKILESGSTMIKSYKEPADRAIESGSNYINSYRQPVIDALQSGTNIINSLQEPVVSIKKVLQSSSDVLTSKVASLGIRDYIPWISEQQERGKKE